MFGVSLLTVFSIDKSAVGMVTAAVSSLLVKSGSGVPEVASAVLG